MKRKLYIDYDTGTVYVQNPKTGKMAGRKSVRGDGDRTAVYRARGTGLIFGRTRSIPKKRLIQVRKHKRTRNRKKFRVRSYQRRIKK